MRGVVARRLGVKAPHLSRLDRGDRLRTKIPRFAMPERLTGEIRDLVMPSDMTCLALADRMPSRGKDIH